MTIRRTAGLAGARTLGTSCVRCLRGRRLERLGLSAQDVIASAGIGKAKPRAEQTLHGARASTDPHERSGSLASFGPFGKRSARLDRTLTKRGYVSPEK